MTRATGQLPTSSLATYAPPEIYTNCVVTVAETAIEFNEAMGGIGMMCMDST